MKKKEILRKKKLGWVLFTALLTALTFVKETRAEENLPQPLQYHYSKPLLSDECQERCAELGCYDFVLRLLFEDCVKRRGGNTRTLGICYSSAEQQCDNATQVFCAAQCEDERTQRELIHQIRG